jgi:hypothetical protein
MGETFSCPECKGTGEYRGLNTVEPCRACGGKWKPLVPDYVRQVGIMASTKGFISAEVFDVLREQSSGGQSIRHEIEEQITEPIEVIFPIESMDQMELDIDWDMGKPKRTSDGMEVEFIVNSIICNLIDIPQERSRYVEYKQLIQGRTPFTAVFQNGEHTHKKENVTMLACRPASGSHMSFILEWEPDDA